MAPLAVLGGGTYVTGPLSLHATTNAEVVNRFLPDAVSVSATEIGSARVRIRPRG